MAKFISYDYPTLQELAEDPSHVTKGLFVLLCIEITIFTVLYHAIYPLEFTPTGYLSQIPIAYWVILTALIFTSTLLAYHTNSQAGSLISTLTFYMVLNSYQFLFYSHVGGDVSGEIRDISKMLNFDHLQPTLSPAFHALQWPNNFTFLFIIKHTLGVQSVIGAMDIGYMSYYIGLTVAIWLFAYRLEGGFFAYLASISYLIISWTWLNNQFVPQLLAQVLLFFLFYVKSESNRRWLVIELILFFSLAFSHPIFAFLYPLVVMLRPGVVSCLLYYYNRFPNDRLFQILLRPSTLLRPVFSIRTWLPNDANTYYRLFCLGTVYASVYLFQYVYLRYQLFRFITVSATESTDNPISEIQPQFPTSGGGSVSESQVALLYDIVPPVIDFVVTLGHQLVVLAMAVLLILSLLASKIETAKEYQVEIAVMGVLVFGFGWAIKSTYALRLLPIVFLPASVFFYGLSNRGKRVVIVCILLLSLISPVLLANFYVDQSLTAGGNTIGYSESQAGKTMENYVDDESVYHAPPNPYPSGGLTTTGAQDVRLLIEDDNNVSDSVFIVYSDRLLKFLGYHQYFCEENYLSNDIIYDNNVQLIRTTPQAKLLSCKRNV